MAGVAPGLGVWHAAHAVLPGGLLTRHVSHFHDPSAFFTVSGLATSASVGRGGPEAAMLAFSLHPASNTSWNFLNVSSSLKRIANFSGLGSSSAKSAGVYHVHTFSAMLLACRVVFRRLGSAPYTCTLEKKRLSNASETKKVVH